MLSTADAGVVRRDSALSGLGLVLDPEALADRINHIFVEAAVESARLLSARYRPSTNCLSLFEITASGSTFLLYAKAYLNEDLEKFKSPRIRRAMPGVFGPGRIVLSHPAVVLYFFPNDHQLRTLPQILGGPLSRIFPEHGAEDAHLEHFDYQPETRFSADVVASGNANATLRTYRPASFQRILHASTVLVNKEILRVEPMLGVSPLYNTLLFGRVEGEPLSARINSGKSKKSEATLVARALAELHGQAGQGLETWAYARELDEAARTVSLLCPDLTRRVWETATLLLERLEAVDAVAPVHGNWAPENVFVGKKAVSFTSFDSAMLAPPDLDLGMCLSSLERRVIYGSSSARRVRSFFDNVLHEYRSATRTGSEQEQLFTAFDLFKNLPEPFSLRLNGWSEITETLLARVEAFASGRGPVVAVPENRVEANGINHLLKNTIGRVATRFKGVRVIDPFAVPSDCSMSFLEKALNPDEVSSRMLQHFPEVLAGAGRRLAEIRVKSYKPGRQCVIEYEWSNASSEGPPLVLTGQVEAPALNPAGFQLLKDLWDGPFRPESEDGITIPRPVGILPEFRMWLQCNVSGFCASDLLIGDDGLSVAAQMARVLYKLHQCPDITTRTFAMEEHLNLLRDHLSGAARMQPQYAARLERILDHCLKLASATPELQSCLIHKNFSADDVLIDGKVLYLLNLDSACQGNRGLDLGSVLGHMKDLALRTTGDPDGLLSCEESLRETYLELSGKPLRQPIKTFTTLNLADQIYASTQSVERNLFTPLLIDLCERRLDILSKNSTPTTRAVFKVR